MEYGKDPVTFLDIFIKSKILDTCRCLPCSSNHPKPCKKNALFTLPRRICTIVENTEEKRKRSENLKLKFSKFQFKKQLTECGIKKHLSALLQEIGPPKTISNDNSIHSNSLSKQSKIL